VPEDTHRVRVCAICKLPITDEQLPCVQLENGDRVHVECYSKSRRPNHRGN
jgi:hypothetical protein